MLHNDQQLDPTTCTVNTISVAQNTPPGQNQPAVDLYSVLQQQNDITALLVQMQTSHCLYYLEQYTRGQPRDVVRSCLHMTAEKGYAVAKQLLKEHFGNEFNITAAYMEKVTGWPSVKSEDAKALKAYGLFLRECRNAMEELRYLEELNTPANMKILSQKLPYKLREKWRTKASDIFERTGQRACFQDIVNFREKQVRLRVRTLHRLKE